MHFIATTALNANMKYYEICQMICEKLTINTGELNIHTTIPHVFVLLLCSEYCDLYVNFKN